VEAHRSYERFEQGHAAVASGDAESPNHARHAALIVAVIACFLAIATFLSNETVKEVITGETHRADISTQLESNRVKIDVAEGNAEMLRVLGNGSSAEVGAAKLARHHEGRVVKDLGPTDRHLRDEIDEREHEVDHANTKHVDYELAEVGFEVGIVLASVSIITRRRWLLLAASGAAAVGLVLLLVGLVLA
jgi:hypothetical protein